MRLSLPPGIVLLAAGLAVGGTLTFLGCTAVGGGLAVGFSQPPRPIIRFDRDRGVAPLAVQFNSDRSSDDGLIVRRNWDFGDGTTSSEVAPLHVFGEKGEFTVTLTLTDDDGLSNSARVTILVTEAPVAIIRVDRTTAENAPATFSFDATASFDPDGTIVGYEWNFDDGSRETEPELEHRFAEPGTYLVRLTVTDNTGVTGEATQLIAVGIPVPAIEILMPDPSLTNLFLTRESPLWIRVAFAVDPSVSFFVRAGIDADRDICDAQAFAFELATGAELGRTFGHLDRVRAAVFLPDGQLLTAGEDSRVARSEISSGDLINSFEQTSPLTSLRLMPDGQFFVFGDVDGRVALANLATGSVVRTFEDHNGAVNALDVTPGGTQILSGSSDGRAILWSAATGEILRDFEHGAVVNAVAINPADPTLVATGGEDGIIRLWNTEGGELLNELSGHEGAVNALVFTPNGLGLLSGGDDDVVRLWNTLQGTQLATYEGHTGDVLAVGISPDGQRVVSGSADTSVRVWDSGTTELLYSLTPCKSPIRSVAFSPDGKQVAVGVGARTAIPLDTDPANGNDLNLTVPALLQLDDVELRTDITNRFFLWAEIATSQGEPVRTYADAVITVFEPFPETFDPNDPPARIGTGDTFNVILPHDRPRQVFNLGPAAAGDRIDLRFLTNPGYSRTFTVNSDYSLMFLDPAGEVIAWYTQRLDNPLTFTNERIDARFDSTSRLVIPEDVDNLYVVADGGPGLNILIRRGFLSELEPTPQRVRIDFGGATSVQVGTHPAVGIPPFELASFFQPGGRLESWSDTDRQTFKDTLFARLDEVFGDYNVEIFSSEDAVQPEFPFQNIYIGDTSGLGVLFAADASDPRNPVRSGNGVIFVGNFLGSIPQTPLSLGRQVGTVAGHVIGRLLGLRPTLSGDDAISRDDIMRFDTVRRAGNVSKVFQVTPTATEEQILNLDSIGVQNAPKYLEQVVGRSSP